METKHTQAPWLTVADRNEIIVYAKSGPHGDDPICFTSDSRPLDEIKANVLLIQAAPLMNKALQEAYLVLQTMVQRQIEEGSHQLAIDTDYIRAGLRNIITEANGWGSQEYQEHIESKARTITQNEYMKSHENKH